MFKTLNVSINVSVGHLGVILGFVGPALAALNIIKRRVCTHACILGNPGVILVFVGPTFEMPTIVKSVFGLHAGIVSHPKVILGLAARLAGTAFED